jgi:hypothetical protein
MENISPSRIQPLTQDQDKGRSENRPRKTPAPRIVTKHQPQPPALDVEPEDSHTLDEQA